METLHSFILEPYNGMNSRFRCPSCQQRGKTFSRYINKNTREYIDSIVGRCNRENNCGYHYKPYQYFKDNNIAYDKWNSGHFRTNMVKPQIKEISFIPFEVFKASLRANTSNHFVKFLINLFGEKVTSQVVSRYFIASSKYWTGATVFWQIDSNGKVRTGKIMLYSPTTGKRVKQPYNHITWVQKALKLQDFELKQCLFGEHLLKEKTKPVAIVESEKTAVIASVYLPQFIWVAVGSQSNLKPENCKVLSGRTVILFPDLNCYNDWSNKAKGLSHFAKISISDLLEQKATMEERSQGLDIADYLIKYDFKEFLQFTKEMNLIGKY
jgi:hypothetical protein